MSQARDEAGNIWEVDAQGNPVRLIQAATRGPSPIVMGQRNPAKALDLPKAQADLAQSQTSQAHTALENTRMQAQAPFVQRQAAADTAKSEAEATMAQQKADAQQAEAALASMTSKSDVHGDAYLQKYVSPAMRETVKAYARGDLGSRSGGLSTSMLPIIQHAMNYDPSASATTFPARAKMHADLAGSQPGTAGGALRAMERMLLHGQEVLNAGQRLDNFGPGLVGTIANTVRTGYERHTNDPRIAGYEELVRNYAPEAQKAIAQTSGGVSERTERGDAFGAALPQAARVAALQGDARQAFDAMGAVNSQYKRLMGRDITDQLSPEAKAAYDRIMSGGYSPDGKPMHPAQGYTPGSVLRGEGGANPPDGGLGMGGGGMPAGPGPGMQVATGATRSIDNTKANGIIDSMIRAGASDEQISAAIQPLGFGPVDARQTSAARSYLRAHPNYQGSFGAARGEAPTTAFNRLAASPVGSAVIAAGALTGSGLNAASGGIINRATGGAVDQLAEQAPGSALVGSLLGSAAGAAGGEALLGKLALRAGFAPAVAATGAAAAVPASGSLVAHALANPVTADAAFGAISGANADPQADIAQSLVNGVVGGVLGAGGSVLGRKVIAPVAARAIAPLVPAINSGLDRVGLGSRQLTTPAAPVAGPVAQALTTARRGGLDSIRSQLSEAADLGVPMTLADTSPGLRSLAGASVRRSASAAQLAEDVLVPRARGQIDRFGQAVERDLGPVANIPQQFEDLTQQARIAAAPLYDQAYGQAVPHTPELGAVLGTPFGRQALARAQTIAANERRNPAELGFAQDEAGNVMLNPQPNRQVADHLAARDALDDAQAAYRAARATPGVDMAAALNRVELARENMRTAEQALRAAPDPTQAASVPAYTQQTLDYVKRGMDDVLEAQRNPLTGRMQLDESGRAQNQVRGQLLSENDALNPAYADARAAYAGPVQARDAMTRGQDALGLTPDELRMQVASQSPEHLAQMQLGYRSQLVENANNLRTAGNPFDAASTLGTPAAVSRLQALHPENPSVANLLRQADLERNLARTNNKVLGNSDTAERTLADKAFGYSTWAVPAAVDLGLMAMGHVPVATAARTVASQGARDAFTMGFGNRAVAKADALAPTLLNPDPRASLQALDGLVADDDLYRAYINRDSVRRIAGLLGTGGGTSALALSQ